MAANDWERLAESVRERRVELGLTQEDARAAGGPSTATMRLIEGALQNSYQPATLRDLEDVLRWERGSVRKILTGGEPVLLADHAGAPRAVPALSPRRDPGARPAGDDPELDLYRQAVLREAYGAIGMLERLGPGELPEPDQVPGAAEVLAAWPGELIFTEDHEVLAWNSETMTLARKIDTIARLRMLWARADEENQRRTGTALIAGNYPRISVAGTASRASH